MNAYRQLRKAVTAFGRPAPWVKVQGAKVGNLLLLQKGKTNRLFLIGLDSLWAFGVVTPRATVSEMAVQSFAKREVGGVKYPTLSLFQLPAETLEYFVEQFKAGDQLKLGASNELRVFGRCSTPNFPWEKNVVAKLKAAKKAYYNSDNPLLTDAEYDYLEDRLREVNPQHQFFGEVGAKVKGNKVKLPVPMASLNKVKNGTGDVTKFVAARRKEDRAAKLVISAKVDGVSGLLQYRKGVLAAAFSRGDGMIGQPILAHVKMARGVPRQLKAKVDLLVRGELVIPDSAFEKKYAEKYANPRNMTAGLVNSTKDIDPAIKDVVFIAHDVMKTDLTPEQRMLVLKKEGFTVVPHKIVEAGKTVGDEGMNKMLMRLRSDLDYYIDGLVLTVSSRKLDYPEDGSNPSNSVAFKENSKSFTATVGEVEWNESKHGLLKPRIRLKTGVKHLGVTITYATAHNASYVQENGIGPGAVVEMVRSGDVIPYIVAVKKKVKPQLPKGEWEWNASGVDIVASGVSNVQAAKRLTHFFTSLEVEGVSLGIVTKLYDAGFTTIPAICSATVQQLVSKVDGVQQSIARRIVEGIAKRLNGIELPKLAYASMAFGRSFGSERLYAIWNEYGNDMMNWKDYKKSEIVEELMEIEGIGATVAKQFADGVAEFVRFFNGLKKVAKVKLVPYKEFKPTSTKLQGMSFVFTGVRDKAIEARIVESGGEVGGAVNKNTTVVIVKDLASTSSKAMKAKELGVKMMSLQQFSKWLSAKGA